MIQKFDFLEWADTNGHGKTKVPMDAMSVMLEFTEHVNSEVKNLHIPECYAPFFKERRLSLSLSMQDVTNKTGVSKSTISRLERGEDPLYKTVLALDKFYTLNGA